MKESPILFKAPMIRGILDETKTETRRIVDAKQVAWLPMLVDVSSAVKPCNKMCRYGYPGDLLWAKETFAPHPDGGGYVYRATDPAWETTPNWCWKPSLFMPRAASRITLEITGLRVEPLLAITEAGAIAEGVEKWPDGNYKAYGKHPGKYTHARDSYLSLWDSINGDKAHRANPWVWVIQFRRL